MSPPSSSPPSHFTFYSSFPLPLAPSLFSPTTTKIFAAFSLLRFILSPKQRTNNGVGLLLFLTFSLPFPFLSPPPSPPPFLPLSFPLHPSCLPSPSLFSPPSHSEWLVSFCDVLTQVLPSHLIVLCV